MPPRVSTVSIAALCLLASTFFPRFSYATPPSPQQAKPNIILILIDALRADYLGYHGFNGPVSQNIDRLAGESVIFRNSFSQAPFTPPSVTSLFTSRYPQVILYPEFFPTEFSKYLSSLSDEYTTLAEALKRHGYQTAGMVGNDWLLAKFGYAQGFDVYEDGFRLKEAKMGGYPHQPSDKRILRRAREWLSTRKSTAPFFLYLHSMDVHAPYICLEKDYTSLVDGITLGTDSGVQPPQDSRRYYLRWIRWKYHDHIRQLRFWRACYASGVRRVDRLLGRFISFLRSSDHLDKTIVVLTSDHGEELYDHLGWDHGKSLHDHQLHVPLLFRFPGKAYGGSVVNAQVRSIDLMPTLLDLAGADASDIKMSGRTLLPHIRGESSAEELPVFSGFVKQHPWRHSIRKDGFKLIWDHPEGRSQLYDLRNDPRELRDVGQSHPKRTDSLRALLQEHVAEWQSQQETGPKEKVLFDEDTKRRLKALGYL